MKENNIKPMAKRRSILRKLGSAATIGATGMAAVPNSAFAEENQGVELNQSVELDTSGYTRVDKASVRISDDGSMEQTLSGHQPKGASPVSFHVDMPHRKSDREKLSTSGDIDKSSATNQLEPKLVRTVPDKNKDIQSGPTKSEGSLETMGHSGSEDPGVGAPSKSKASMTLIVEQRNLCACTQAWEVWNYQNVRRVDSSNEECISEDELVTSQGQEINPDSCWGDWEHDRGYNWTDVSSCDADVIREDDWKFDNGENRVRAMQQIYMYDDGSWDWEVKHYSDGGNRCLIHRVNIE